MPRDFDRNDLSSLHRERMGSGGTEAPGEEVCHEVPDTSWHTSSPGASVPPRKDGGAWWKVLAALGVGCLSINLIIGMLAVAGLAVGLSSCVSSCSDNPLGDSRENAAFIADLTATERDLATFDALDGVMESVCTKLAAYADEGEHVATAAELRAQVAAGTWPKDENKVLSPRVWVRIAELSEDWLEDKTGERWEVVDFAYPFPDNGPIPVPPTRDEDDFCSTRLLCTEGADQGIYTTVAYYRWAKDAYFKDALDEDRTQADELVELDQKVADTGLLEGRSYLLSQGELFVWAQGDDDPLRDPEAFLEAARPLTELLGDYRDVVLLKADTPAVLGLESLSYEYPSNHPVETVAYVEARARLLRTNYVLFFDYAAGDVLLSVHRQQGEDLTLESITGTLAPTPRGELRHPWRPPSEECSFDEAMAAEVAGMLGMDPERVIVASHFDTSDRVYDGLYVWLIVPAGALPETPDAFCSTADSLRDAFWATITLSEGKNAQLYLHIFEVDEETLANAEGEAVTFAQLREVALARPADLDGYHVDLLLTAMSFGSQWEGEEEPSLDPMRPQDVGGSVARSRSWRYSEE